MHAVEAFGRHALGDECVVDARDLRAAPDQSQVGQVAGGQRAHRVEVVLVGRIDRDAADALDAAYAAASLDCPASIELDFTGVDYINSTGIALIVGVLARARAQSYG